MSENRIVYGTKEFLQSNSIIAKVSFLFLILFLFVILLRLGMSFLGWLLSSSNSPKLINGMIDSKQMLVFPQDPNVTNSTTIYRSINATDGLEFTWSVWIYIDDLQYLSGQYRHIFHKGNSQLNSNGKYFPNNAPGLYISPNTNSLVAIMNSFNDINEEITIPNIPLNKWVNVILRCQNNKLNIYINGTITQSRELAGVPKQNYGDVFVSGNGGFSGHTSNLWYYNYALGTSAINNLVSNGPNLKIAGSSALGEKFSKYLSLRWYFYGNENGYNGN
jgi:hypothetical protein